MPGSKKSVSDQPKLGELISAKEAAELSGFTQRHIRLLISRGELWGQKLGRDWFTTTQAVRAYLARNRRPGPKPKQRT